MILYYIYNTNKCRSEFTVSKMTDQEYINIYQALYLVDGDIVDLVYNDGSVIRVITECDSGIDYILDLFNHYLKEET